MVRIKLVGCNFNKTSNKTIENDVVRLIREPENKLVMLEPQKQFQEEIEKTVVLTIIS